MDTAELEKYIHRRLDESAQPGEITFEICERTSLYWPDVEKLVQRVAVERDKKHNGKTLTVSATWSSVVMLAGFVLTFGAAGAYILMYRSVTFTRFDAMNANSTLLTTVHFGPILLAIGILGMGMMVGAILGMREMWENRQNKDNEQIG